MVHYYMSDFFNQNQYAGFRYNDKYFNIHWPKEPNIISKRDLEYENFDLNTIL